MINIGLIIINIFLNVNPHHHGQAILNSRLINLGYLMVDGGLFVYLILVITFHSSSFNMNNVKPGASLLETAINDR